MYAEFLIHHKPLDTASLKKYLSTKFHTENRVAISESPMFGAGEWDNEILFATKTPAYRLLCVPTQDEETQVFVEPVKGNVLTVCESVWSGTKNALSEVSPTLSSLKLVDNESGKDFLTASPLRLLDELKRKETLSPIIVAIAAIVYATIGVLTFASEDGAKFLAGAVSGLVAALVSVAFAVGTSKKGKLVWR